MELNTSGLRKIYSQMNPGPEMLAMMSERGIPVVVGSDSHVPERVTAHFGDALDHLEDAGYREVQVFEHRKPKTLTIESVRDSLAVPA
ncbi:MAG: histidinol-phosphatase, partial [Verrucomicrobiota bacterium]